MTVLTEVGIVIMVNRVLLDSHVLVGFGLGALGLSVLVSASKG